MSLSKFKANSLKDKHLASEVVSVKVLLKTPTAKEKVVKIKRTKK